jgi:hypothetical protein
MEMSWCSQTLTEVKLENTGVKPVMSVAMHQRQQQLKYSVSYNVVKQWIFLGSLFVILQKLQY